jgi:hypothetical protein
MYSKKHSHNGAASSQTKKWRTRITKCQCSRRPTGFWSPEVAKLHVKTAAKDKIMNNWWSSGYKTRHLLQIPERGNVLARCTMSKNYKKWPTPKIRTVRKRKISFLTENRSLASHNTRATATKTSHHPSSARSHKVRTQLAGKSRRTQNKTEWLFSKAPTQS